MRRDEVDGVSGELCYLTRCVLDATGGLDTNYDPVFGDDDDFCLLARYHGFRCFVESSVRAVHYSPRVSAQTNHCDEPTGVLAKVLADRSELQIAHRDYFARKWGFDPTAPDLHELRRRYGHTRICWQIGEGLLEELPERPAVDVCFVTWNSMQVLPRAMERLLATEYPDMRIWVTDNGSTDGTFEYLEELAASSPFPMHVERIRQNVGVAQALNLAFERGDAPLVARLDDDTLVPPEWLERLGRRFHQRPYAGVIGCRVLHDDVVDALQSGPSREAPKQFYLTGQDYERVKCLARVATLRGCCNLYRRSVFDKVGLLDPRFSPSQYDEWDHHIACCVAGYEVLYDGTVTVRHLLTTGRISTPEAFGNGGSNRKKSDAKWGGRHLPSIEIGIDLSIDGRLLPPDGDTTALYRGLVAPSGPEAVVRDPVEIAKLAVVARRCSVARAAGGPLDPFYRSLARMGEEGLRTGSLGLTRRALWAALDIAPTDPFVLAFVARYQLSDGTSQAALRTAENARRLAPENEELARRLAGVKLPDEQPEVFEAASAPAEPRASSHPGAARVLLLEPLGGRNGVLEESCRLTAEALRAVSADVRIESALAPEVRGFDVVHAFGFDDSLVCRLQLARAVAPDATIVLSPLQPDPRRCDVAGTVLREVAAAADDQLVVRLRAAAKLQAQHGFEAMLEDAVVDPVQFAYERAAMRFVDRVFVHRERDRERFERYHPGHAVHRVREGVELPPAEDAEGLPCAHGGVVQCGARDLPGMHLALVMALTGTGVPLALCGQPAFPYVDGRTQQRNDSLWLGPLLEPAQRSAVLQRSAVCVQLDLAAVSFAVPLQAALAGCELVLPRGVGAEDVFGDRAHYVDAFDVDEVRRVVLAARNRWLLREGGRVAGEVRGALSYGEELLRLYGRTCSPTVASTALTSC